MPLNVEVDGLAELVRILKGPKFRDVNFALREHAGQIAERLMPAAQAATRQSRAPQAHAMAATYRVKRDRVPVLSLGKVNPRFGSGFRRRGASASSTARRRGSLAHGVTYGPKGGPNYYRIPRDPSGGPLGAAMRPPGGRAYRQALDAYLRAYLQVLRAAGFQVEG